METLEITETITPSIHHLPQNETAFSDRMAFDGLASSDSVSYQGRNFRVIDKAIAVEERKISATAEKIIWGSLAAIAVAATATTVFASMSAFPIIATVSPSYIIGIAVIGTISAILCGRAASHVDPYDANYVASQRKQWNPNERRAAISDAYQAFGGKVKELEKFFTTAELKYAFNREFAFSAFSEVTAKVHLRDAVQFLGVEFMRDQWKAELSQKWESAESFFSLYDDGKNVQLSSMLALGIITKREWEIIQSFKSKMDEELLSHDLMIDSLQKKELQELTQAEHLRDLEVRNARLEHDQNWAVCARNIVVANGILPSRESNHAALVRAGLSIATILAAEGADRLMYEKISDANINYGQAKAAIETKYAPQIAEHRAHRKHALQKLQGEFLSFLEYLKAVI